MYYCQHKWTVLSYFVSKVWKTTIWRFYDALPILFSKLENDAGGTLSSQGKWICQNKIYVVIHHRNSDSSRSLRFSLSLSLSLSLSGASVVVGKLGWGQSANRRYSLSGVRGWVGGGVGGGGWGGGKVQTGVATV